MKKEKLFAGFDCHKETHHGVVIDLEAKEILNFEILNCFEDLKSCAKQLASLSKEFDLKIGVEGSRHYGLHLSNALRKEGLEVLEINPNLTNMRRKHTFGLGKNDEMDAHIVARTTRDEHHKLSELNFEPATEILIKLSKRRDDLVQLRINELLRLHFLLMEIDPEYKKKGDIRFRATQEYWYKFSDTKLKPKEDALYLSRLHCIRNMLNSIKFLEFSIRSTEKLMDEYKTHEISLLMSLPGIALVNACRIMACIGNIKRFANMDKLASYAGLCPIVFASGKTSHARVNKKGNRQLNSVLDSMALTALRYDDISKQYYEKKLKEGKTKRQARKYLARRILKLVYALLTKREYYDPNYYEKKKRKVA